MHVARLGRRSPRTNHRLCSSVLQPPRFLVRASASEISPVVSKRVRVFLGVVAAARYRKARQAASLIPGSSAPARVHANAAGQATASAFRNNGAAAAALLTRVRSRAWAIRREVTRRQRAAAAARVAATVKESGRRAGNHRRSVFRATTTAAVVVQAFARGRRARQ